MVLKVGILKRHSEKNYSSAPTPHPNGHPAPRAAGRIINGLKLFAPRAPGQSFSYWVSSESGQPRKCLSREPPGKRHTDDNWFEMGFWKTSNFILAFSVATGLLVYQDAGCWFSMELEREGRDRAGKNARGCEVPTQVELVFDSKSSPGAISLWVTPLILKKVNFNHFCQFSHFWRGEFSGVFTIFVDSEWFFNINGITLLFYFKCLISNALRIKSKLLHKKSTLLHLHNHLFFFLSF